MCRGEAAKKRGVEVFFESKTFSPSFSLAVFTLSFPFHSILPSTLRRTSPCSWPRPSWRRRCCRWPCLFVSKFLSFAARKKKWKKVRRRGERGRGRLRRGASGKASLLNSSAEQGIEISQCPCSSSAASFLPSVSLSLFTTTRATRPRCSSHKQKATHRKRRPREPWPPPRPQRRRGRRRRIRRRARPAPSPAPGSG